MRSCREPSCISWPLMRSDQYCSWCGRRLVEVEAVFESKLGDEWVRLDPPVLNRERPPSLRLKVAHVGEAGHLKLTPADIRINAPWLDLDCASLGEEPLKPGDSVYFSVRKLKVPGPDDLPHEIRIHIGQQEIRASTSLTFVPAPEFYLETTTSEIVLSSDADPYVEGAIVLRKGRVWMENEPQLDPAWARLECLQSEPELELDALERPRYPFRFVFSEEELSLLRQRSADQQHPLQRQGVVRFAYLDRGQKGSGSFREHLKAELPVQFQFILAPELFLEPFGYELRRDWSTVLGLRQRSQFDLVMHNGPPGAAPRQELIVQQLRVRDADTQEELPVDGSEIPPWRIQSDRPVSVRLRLPKGWQQPSGVGFERRLQIIPVSNDPVQRLFHLRLSAQPARPFPGYLVIDLGTTATCAALVSESKAVERVLLHGENELPSATCYLKMVQEQLWEVGQSALRRSLEPAAARSVIVQAKRKIGSDEALEVVPLDEPAETVFLQAREAMSHLYREVLDQALRLRLASGSPEVLQERLLITHPSRFSLRQVEQIKEAAMQAHREHWKHWTGEERQDLPPPVTLHEPTGAAFHFLRDWNNLSRVHGRLGRDELTWHLLVYDLGGGTLDVTLMRLESLQQACEGGGFAYLVAPSVMGATGERWFGGQDVTLRLKELVHRQLTRSLTQGQWPDPNYSDAQRIAWQRNQNLLTQWCEQFKLHLVQGKKPEESWQSFPGLTLWEQGRERLVTSSHWRQGVELPGLQELESAVEPMLVASLQRVREMLERHQVESPDVVLRVGKASQLPCIQRALEQCFAESLLVAPDQLKGCVVEGACVPPLPGLPSGVQMSRGLRRPGVRFRWNPKESYTATTCRLGLQVLDSGETWFQEVLPEGAPIPSEGLQRRLGGLYLEAGPTTLVILENAGYEDSLLVEGKPNRDIQVLARCPIVIPTLSLAQTEGLELVFELQSDWSLAVTLEAPDWGGLEVVRLDGSQLGRQY